MAVEIVRRGVPQAQRKIAVICRQCDTHFTFLAADARRVSDQRDGDYFSLACPQCGTTVTKSVARGYPPYQRGA